LVGALLRFNFTSHKIRPNGIYTPIAARNIEHIGYILRQDGAGSGEG